MVLTLQIISGGHIEEIFCCGATGGGRMMEPTVLIF